MFEKRDTEEYEHTKFKKGEMETIEPGSHFIPPACTHISTQRNVTHVKPKLDIPNKLKSLELYYYCNIYTSSRNFPSGAD